jgi:hypothetical protein
MRSALLNLLLCALLSLFSGTPLQAQTAGGDGFNNRVGCSRLLGMVQRLVLPTTKQGTAYPSGFKFEGPHQFNWFVAYFFGSLRTPELRELVLNKLEEIPMKEKIFFLHNLSFAMALTTYNLGALLSADKPVFKGQEDGTIDILLHSRAQYIADDLLPQILASPADAVSPFFEELTAIAATSGLDFHR